MSDYLKSLTLDHKRGVYIPTDIELYLVVNDFTPLYNWTAKKGSYVYLKVYTPEEDLGNHSRYVIYDTDYNNHGNLTGFIKVRHNFQKTGWTDYDQMLRDKVIDKILES